jgi:2-dehydropantoate 2-reductase
MDAVHIVGAGGIGCAVGHALARCGVQVTFVETSAARIAHGRRRGVAVDRLPPVRADFVPFVEWQPPRDGVVLLCTKAYDNGPVLERRRPGVALVPIQNGFDAALMREPHVEGIASFVSECPAGTTHTQITRGGRLHLGVAGRADRRLDGLARRLAAALRGAPFRVTRVDDVLPYKHTKLMYNAAISPLAAAAGLDNGELLRRPPLRVLFFALLRENHAILEHAGIELGKVGPFRPRTVARILARPWLARALAWLFYPGLRGTYCSMAGDLPHGPTEIDTYNGYLVGRAGDFPCPLNRAVLALIGRIVAARTPPRPALLDGLFDRAVAA